ncbi:MAG: hypothetical protein IPN89_15410 [Saprospiraceae bacterium]|nr:hypothetical protein [Saprospiraceae bacterium]
MQIFINDIFSRNRMLAYMGAGFLILAVLLCLYAFINPHQVLGINSMIKPIKFCISTWAYAWTMAYLLFYVNNQKKVKWYSILASFVMIFENGVIIVQAFRGKISHFNQSELVGGILYALMGVLIVWLTTATLVIAVRFILQKTYTISSPFALSIKIGLIMFVIFSFLGGYMSAINTHNIGGEIGQAGLPFLNWSTLFGDVRVAHFFGIHSLQIIPLFGYIISARIYEESKSKTFIWSGALLYFGFVCFTMYQALEGAPFIRLH